MPEEKVADSSPKRYKTVRLPNGKTLQIAVVKKDKKRGESSGKEE